MDAKQKAEFDQALSLFRDAIPMFWWSTFQGLRTAGFSKKVSLDLLKTYVLGQGAGSIHPPASDSEEEDQ